MISRLSFTQGNVAIAILVIIFHHICTLVGDGIRLTSRPYAVEWEARIQTRALPAVVGAGLCVPCMGTL